MMYDVDQAIQLTWRMKRASCQQEKEKHIEFRLLVNCKSLASEGTNLSIAVVNVTYKNI